MITSDTTECKYNINNKQIGQFLKNFILYRILKTITLQITKQQ